MRTIFYSSQVSIRTHGLVFSDLVCIRFTNAIPDSIDFNISPVLWKPQQPKLWRFLTGNSTINGKAWLSAMFTQASGVSALSWLSHASGPTIRPLGRSYLPFRGESHKPNLINSWFTNSLLDWMSHGKYLSFTKGQIIKFLNSMKLSCLSSSKFNQSRNIYWGTTRRKA